MEKVDIAIVGAGVVGLALAFELSRKTNKTVAVVEKNNTFGLETSSRNSQVIHSGIYYPTDMLKTRLCIQGKDLLYEFCQKYRVGHKRVGKLVVAAEADEQYALHQLMDQAEANQVATRLISAHELHHLEPSLRAYEALSVPDSGIVDVYQLMKQLYYLGQENGVIFAFNSCLTDLSFNGWEYILQTNRDKFRSEWIINSAGLASDYIPTLLGLYPEDTNYRIYPCKGDYYRLKKPPAFKHLIYPLPSSSGTLGIHITPDLSGTWRLGPNAYDVSTLNYDIDESHRGVFWASIRRLMPDLQPNDIAPDYCGIRPRRQKSSEPLQDFLIAEESDRGLPGFINLIGIESPGLTSCLAIAKYVENILL